MKKEKPKTECDLDLIVKVSFCKVHKSQLKKYKLNTFYLLDLLRQANTCLKCKIEVILGEKDGTNKGK